MADLKIIETSKDRAMTMQQTNNKILVIHSQCILSDTMESSTGLGPPHDLETDSNSFSISGAHLVKDRLQKLYLEFC